MSFLKRHVLKVKYISLVNLISGKEVVKELVADKMTPEELKQEMTNLLLDNTYCKHMLNGYASMAERLGPAGAPARAARIMNSLLHDKYGKGQNL